ncbi:MAG TPA: hypothetical protein VFQ80_10505 [Thermomicrobiales bacterium]|nr:hypothetical protein [Thermomicrobiales bacterium]
MDCDRFDAISRALAQPASRRRTLGAVVAAALAPAAAAARPEPAKCLAQGKRCSLPPSDDASPGHGKRGDKGGKGKHHPRSCAKCCSRYGAAGADGKARCSCKPEGETCDGPSQCCGGLCRNGVCTACPGDLTACNGNCVDLQTDDRHCGSCEHACADGQRCVGGNCVCDGTSCPRGCCGGPDGTTCQRGTDDAACGIGGAACQSCGACTTCDGTQCVNATACCGDTSSCQGGACVACAAGQRCQGGQCVCNAASCPNGCCNGATCVPFADQTDQRCGTGGAACKSCTGHDTCGGGGTNGACGCTPTTCVAQGKNCGTIPDGCGNTIDCGACVAPDTCGGGDPSVPNVCGCTSQCAGKSCDADDECGGKCPCPSDSPICHHNTENNLICCCLSGTTNARCIANEADPTRICCCSISSLTPTPRCLFSATGAICCCGNPQHICTDTGCQPPPP